VRVRHTDTQQVIGIDMLSEDLDLVLSPLANGGILIFEALLIITPDIFGKDIVIVKGLSLRVFERCEVGDAVTDHDTFEVDGDFWAVFVLINDVFCEIWDIDSGIRFSCNVKIILLILGLVLQELDDSSVLLKHGHGVAILCLFDISLGVSDS